jgi:glycosyltransferase involved in cell wall biosynthesis|tara:strand:+ start:1340 stop:2614 length:1275 start_codon:yes stop_codon:yes gene_type:complete
MGQKKKILTLGDHPLSPSGVGTQTKYFIEGLLATGNYQVISLGGAIKHENLNPVKTEEWGDDWVIHPVDGYGTKEMVRAIVRAERPDVVWFMTDPRFWGWLWEIENEIRPLAPMVYYHVWDNYPYPSYNKAAYESNDHVVTISKLTTDIVRTVAPAVDCTRIPHVPGPAFKIFTDEEKEHFKQNVTFPWDPADDKTLFFWNNRNARRKQSGSLIYWFKSFLDKVGHDKASLILHTDPKDPHGQDLEYLLNTLGLTNGEVLLSTAKIPPEILAGIYNIVDCTINISDAEGFGLSTLESLACGTPIIVNMTGGLQEQVTDGENWFGFGLEPTSKAIIGSQEIPMIYEDRLSEESVVDALLRFFNLSQEEKDEMGRLGHEHVKANYGLEETMKMWTETMDEIIEKHGSWDNRKNYKSWYFEEIKKAA